jgi:hypothetical protein
MMNLRTIIVFFIIIFLSPVYSLAGMDVLSESELSGVIAGAGVSADIKGSAVRITVDSVYIEDTDTDRIELNDLVIDDGLGGEFSFDTPEGKPLSIDVGADDYGRTVAHVILPQHIEATVAVGNLLFCGKEIGSLTLDHVSLADEILNMGAHGGVDLDYAGRLDIDSIQYAYSTEESLILSGIHLAGSAQGNPEKPDGWPGWSFSGLFQAGVLSNPVTIDCGTDSADVTRALFNLPLQGCIRVEDVAGFGPCAIDGITTDYIKVQIPK